MKQLNTLVLSLTAWIPPAGRDDSSLSLQYLFYLDMVTTYVFPLQFEYLIESIFVLNHSAAQLNQWISMTLICVIFWLSITLFAQCFELLCFVIHEHLCCRKPVACLHRFFSDSFFIFVQFDSNFEPRVFPFQNEKFIEHHCSPSLQITRHKSFLSI